MKQLFLPYAYGILLLSFLTALFQPALQAHEQEPAGVRFIANQGQWQGPFQFKADILGGSMFAGPARITYAFYHPEDMHALHRHEEKASQKGITEDQKLLRMHAFALQFEGARETAPIRGKDPAGTYHNYYLGNDPAQWQTRVPTYHQIHYEALYPGTDLLVYSRSGHPKYEFHLEAGASPTAIKMQYVGADGLHIKDGNLVIETSIGDFTELKPFSYQLSGQDTLVVETEFVLTGTSISFFFPEGYDNGRKLVIDPILIGSSYSGMTFSSQYGFTATYDNDGNIYGAGEAFGTGFPITLGAFQTSFAGSQDLAITKFNEDASNVHYATYLGGSSTDLPHSMIVDASGDLLVMGTTSSSNFPFTAGAYDNTYNGNTDIFVARLSSDGTALLASTAIGGSNGDGSNVSTALTPNYGDANRGEVNLDNAGNVYVASVTSSFNFPVSPGAYQPAKNGSQDACVFKLSPDLSTLLFSTFLGGSQAEGASALKVLSTGEVVTVGGTTSSNFPTTTGVIGTSYAGGTADGFVSILSPDGSSLLQSTFLGTGGQDIAYFVELDDDDHVYVAGNCGPSFPISAGVYSNPNSTQFITRLSADFSALDWSTQIGGGTGGGFSGMELALTAFLVDICGNIYLGGFTDVNMAVTPDAFMPVQAGSGDFYFAVLEPDATALLYGTYMGGSGWEHVDGGTSRYSKEGIVYQASCTNSSDFPITAGAAYPIKGPSWDRLVFKFDFEFAGVEAEFGIAGDVTYGCAPLTVTLDNLSTGADSYYWDFGTADTSSTFEPVYTYTDTGTYTITLIAYADDTATACGIVDTTLLQITVIDTEVEADFDYIQNCDSLSVQFFNESSTLSGNSYSWDFGDGSSSNLMEPEHFYDSTGTYTVSLIVSNDSSCNLADTLTQTVVLGADVIAGFTHDMPGCLPTEVNFISGSLADTYRWSFGNGDSASVADTSVTYTAAGAYEVQLIMIDSSTCNIADTATVTLSVEPLPVAGFTFSPPNPAPQAPLQFENLSSEADTYEWDFGDGSFSTEVSPIHRFEQSGAFEVCLTAYNLIGCEDEYCELFELSTSVQIPNAFTPNGDGKNDFFNPLVSAGIEDFQLQVFNRWGELLYEGGPGDPGWDGSFQGKPQEIGTYIYYLIYTDGREIKKQGNVTLLR